MSRAAIRVILVRPETAANIGAVARVIRNTDLAGLDLVAPGDWRTLDCWRTAWGAQDVLEQARVFESLESAVAGAGFVAAFTGKKDREAPLEDVRETAATIAGLDADLSAALVFGPEDAGLTRAELALCGRRVAIPAHSQQPSLNLSHAVMVAAYEVFRARASGRAAPRRASHAEKQAMLLLLRDGLARVGALPAANSEGYFLDWQNLFQRADLTPKEVRLLEHLARKLKGRE